MRDHDLLPTISSLSVHDMSFTFPESGVLPIPLGQSAPFAVVTRFDHRAWIYIATTMSMAMILLASAIRVFTKYKTCSGWGLDDRVLLASTVSLARNSRTIEV